MPSYLRAAHGLAVMLAVQIRRLDRTIEELDEERTEYLEDIQVLQQNEDKSRRDALAPVQQCEREIRKLQTELKRLKAESAIALEETARIQTAIRAREDSLAILLRKRANTLTIRETIEAIIGDITRVNNLHEQMQSIRECGDGTAPVNPQDLVQGQTEAEYRALAKARFDTYRAVLPALVMKYAEYVAQRADEELRIVHSKDIYDAMAQ